MEKIRLNADKWNDRFVINFFRIICVIEVILIGYFNLIKLRYYCEYDSSSYFLKAYEMYRQRTLFISDWVDQTSLYFDSPVPPGGTVDERISQYLSFLWYCKLYDYSGKHLSFSSHFKRFGLPGDEPSGRTGILFMSISDDSV